MSSVKFYLPEEQVPLEMHKVRVVQKLHLLPVEERLEKLKEAGNNTFLLQNKDVFMDMLTDSGVNAMSDNQVAAMSIADDSYAGSETCNRLLDSIKEVFGTEHFLPAHQGRACENILAETFVKPGMFTLMNFHFTTTKAHITRMGGSVIELVRPEGLVPANDEPFKGNFDIPRLKQTIKDLGAKNIAFVRIEAGTNLIGGQPVSLENMLEVAKICKENGILSVLDASLLQDNLYFMKIREEQCKEMSIKKIMHKLGKAMDLIYFSSRKLGFARGGAIISNNEELILRMKEYIPLYEGFLTYGGMEVRSMEAMAVGLRETLDMEIISQGPLFTKYLVDELDAYGVPMVKPAGGLGAHVNAGEIVPHIPHGEYPAAALATAFYIAGGIRGMERGTLSEQRNPDGSEQHAEMELVRLALPRRVFTLSQVKYCADRVKWVYDNRHLIGGLRWEDEPKVLRFFFGRLQPIGDWQEKLAAKFREDFGDSL
ncbi:tryptophanase [Alloprevotella sp. OH1205_COT-284]|uniref:tryptophanase n=1 Tax=Alloprevotella sp. OH1205_COT-284 TaxID=2491043 RepID=UPI000F600A0E|nr:tryptophanase [Alloprevotella sp. OH1205_COT-284]RRD80796.1 tryptophanase [Alloprevotella sp. OH1205_COT-284]